MLQGIYCSNAAHLLELPFAGGRFVLLLLASAKPKVALTMMDGSSWILKIAVKIRLDYAQTMVGDVLDWSGLSWSSP